MGPEIIVVLGVLFGAGFLKFLETMLSKDKPKAVMSYKDSTAYELDSAEPLACDALVPRVFEQRLVDAGIMKVSEMTVCDSEGCADCRPTRIASRKCAVAECNRVGTHRWNNNEELCDGHLTERQSLDKKNELKGIGKRQKKITLPGGGTADWPKQVPEYAAYNVMRMDSGRGAMINYRVMFTWINDQGRVTNVKMVVPDFTHMSDSFVVYSDQNEKPVAQWGGSFSGISTTKEHRASLERRGYTGTMPPKRPSMSRKEHIEVIRKHQRELRKNPPKPPKGKGGGSPSTGPR